MQTKIHAGAYIASDGSYSQHEEVLLIDVDALSHEQWELISELSDNDRLEYAIAVLSGEDTSEWE